MTCRMFDTARGTLARTLCVCWKGRGDLRPRRAHVLVMMQPYFVVAHSYLRDKLHSYICRSCHSQRPHLR